MKLKKNRTKVTSTTALSYFILLVVQYAAEQGKRTPQGEIP
jgi:hypothetical protein